MMTWLLLMLILPVIFSNDLEVVPRVLTLLKSNCFFKRYFKKGRTSCILASVEAISSKSVLEALVIAPT